MGKNLELKMKVKDHHEIINSLRKNNAEFIETLTQKDIYYEYKDGLLKLRSVNGRGEFIKYNRNENSFERWSDYNILNVQPDEAEKFFGDLFQVEVVVIKQRNLWIYKNTRIHLDDVENLGNFIELETVVQNDLDEARREFDEAAGFLNLDLNEQLKTSYRTLLLNK